MPSASSDDSAHALHPTAVNQGSAEQFYAGAMRRIPRFLVGLAGPAVVGGWLVGGPLAAAGVLAGAVIAFVNFRSMARSVEALGERIAAGSSRESGGRIVGRFLFRYLLIGAASYAILVGSRQAFFGFLTGLLLPAAAMAVEAGYEAWMAIRRGW